jgi:predicted ATP-binding protein involved in virulence
MKDFKLIAIRPLANCDPKFLKALKGGHIYTFYKEFSLVLGNEDVQKIKFSPRVPTDLYREEAPRINISAIVGKNGAGKSALFELLFSAIFMLAVDEEILIPNFKSLEKDLAELEEKNAQSPEFDFINRKESILQTERYFKELKDQIKVEVYYQLDDAIYKLCIRRDANENLMKFEPQIENGIRIYENVGPVPFDIRSFFYTIAVNYSLHGLNSKHSGNWIAHLFHKNDGYRTPIVINPWRNEGNIDVNIENHLAQTRLLANLTSMTQSSFVVIEKKKVMSITFALDLDKIVEFMGIKLDNVLDRLARRPLIIQKFAQIYRAMLGVELSVSEKQKDVLHFDLIVKYTIRKVLKIAFYYQEYRERYAAYPEKGKMIPRIKNFDEYLSKLRMDNSHITLKLRQILNTVRFNLLRESPEMNIRWKDGKLTLPIDEYVKRILDLSSPKNDIPGPAAGIEIIELVPAAFYRPELNVAVPGSTSSKFEILSSGEQQFAHTIHSILYHILNLDSVFRSGDLPKERPAYSIINIALDEVELYFHPEFQQKMIKEIIGIFDRVKIPNIDVVNIIFATHSPFILSDIPSANVLLLREGEVWEGEGETFGTNIHELLHNDFFLENETMGRWAKETTIKIINDIKAMRNPTPEEINRYKMKISLIGEPFIKSKLLEMLNSKSEN